MAVPEPAVDVIDKCERIKNMAENKPTGRFYDASTTLDLKQMTIMSHGEITMSKEKGTDTNSSGPIHLDLDQLQQLDKLIQNLRKEVIVPAKKSADKSVTSSETEKG